MTGLIGEIAEFVPTFGPDANNQQINELFKHDRKCSGVVVVENKVPIGLITRTNFYQKLGTLYGYNLYIDKSIQLLMNTNILAVDYSTSIIEVSKKAMSRDEAELYDYVIVTESGLYAGAVSISRLLMKFAEVQSQFASFLNPLTGLPGNRLIHEKMSESLSRDTFTVLYFDIDYFKTYNDIYGFAKGDQVIQATATLLKNAIMKRNGFLGHIGGDDFLAILYHHDYSHLCRSIIRDFDSMVQTVYTQEHLAQKYVLAEDRLGEKRKIPLLSISIAVISNQFQPFTTTEEIINQATEMKKLCKRKVGSCYLDVVHSIS
ncbi:diguanylate cyclase domain-containing protein [Pseudoneobacillus sp. C159]